MQDGQWMNRGAATFLGQRIVCVPKVDERLVHLWFKLWAVYLEISSLT